MAAPKLKKPHKEFLVRCFAAFLTNPEAVAALKLHFGVEITPQAASYHNPEGPDGAIAGPFAELFDEARKAFLLAVESVPIAHQAVRMRRLEQIYTTEAGRKATPMMRATLEQAARERGGYYTNRRELTGAGGAPLVPPSTAGDKKRRLAKQMLRKLVESGKTEAEAREELARAGIGEEYLVDAL